MRYSFAAVIALATVVGSLPLSAQGRPASATSFEFSGEMFGNFQKRTDAASKAANGGESPNKFEMERVYLTFAMPAGARTSVSVTTDIFQNTAVGAYYGGWAMRLKYGYINRELTRRSFGVRGLVSSARVGVLQTVVVEHTEGYWPRALGTVGTERNGFFSSSDVGAAALFTLPGRRGEAYVTFTNGTGDTAPETDRFKDYAGRLSLTPFASSRRSGLRNLVVTPWYSKGFTASKIANVSEGVPKDRSGLFVGLKDHRLTGGAEFARRVEGFETGTAATRVVKSLNSELTSYFAVVRPMEYVNKRQRTPFGIVARYDSFKLTTAPAPAKPTQSKFSVIGVFWDMSSGSTITVDMQALDPVKPAATPVPTKTLFVHWKADF